MPKVDSFRWLIPPEKVLTLRTSFIKMYLRCPAQAMFRYFKGLIVLPRSYTTFGRCFHKTAEHQNKYKLRKGRDERLSNLQDVFHTEFKILKPKTQWLKKEDPDEIEQEGTKRILPLYYEQLAKKVKPKYVEEPILIDYPEYNLKISGQLDLIETNNLIRDMKTKSRKPNWMDAIKSTQKVAYSIGFKSRFKKDPLGFLLDYILRTKTPTIERSKIERITKVEEEEFKKMVCNIGLSVRQGLFYPKRENNYLCSPNTCGYWSICTKGAWMKVPLEQRTYMANDQEVTEGEEEGE